MLPILQDKTVLTMSSREIADLVGTTHDSVLKTVRDYRTRGVVSGNETPYQHPQNKQIYSEFHLCKRDAMVIASGYSVELRARIIDRWQELESNQPENPLLQLANAVLTAQSIIADQSQKLLIAEPKAAALDLIAGSDDSRCIRDTAKDLKIKPSTLTKYLLENSWIYRQARDDAKLGKVMAYMHRIDQGLIEHCSVVIEQKGQTKLATSVKITGKGFAKLSLVFSGDSK